MLTLRPHPTHLLLAAAAALALAACGGGTAVAPAASSNPDPTLAAAPESAPPGLTPPAAAAPVEVVHLITPGVFRAATLQQVLDCNTGRRVAAGTPLELNPLCDDWATNELERPMDDAGETYLPWIDILRVEFGADASWHYLRIHTASSDAGAASLDGAYALELDLDLDGRGDLLILALRPARAGDRAWSVAGVQVWRDENRDIGGASPAARDDDAEGDGFEALRFDQGLGDDPDLAWARLDADTPGVVEIAFKHELLGGAPAFAWWAWAAQALDPAAFDLIDSFDPDDLYPVDNTCAWIYGRTTQTVPNQCPAIADPATPTAPAGACTAPPEGCAAKFGDPCYLWIQQRCECVCFN